MEMKPIINLISTQMQTSLEGEIYRAVQRVGVEVDKERLVQALTDARVFYSEGYEAGRRNKPKWISVEERLPEYGKYVLVADERNRFIGLFSLEKTENHMFWRDMGNWVLDVISITHWMPIPEPPEV